MTTKTTAEVLEKIAMYVRTARNNINPNCDPNARAVTIPLDQALVLLDTVQAGEEIRHMPREVSATQFMKDVDDATNEEKAPYKYWTTAGKIMAMFKDKYPNGVIVRGEK